MSTPRTFFWCAPHGEAAKWRSVCSVFGGLAAIAAGLLIQAEFFGVPGVDVRTLGASAALLATAMLLASLLPARRAARMDPNAVLREE